MYYGRITRSVMHLQTRFGKFPESTKVHLSFNRSDSNCNFVIRLSCYFLYICCRELRRKYHHFILYFNLNINETILKFWMIFIDRSCHTCMTRLFFRTHVRNLIINVWRTIEFNLKSWNINFWRKYYFCVILSFADVNDLTWFEYYLRKIYISVIPMNSFICIPARFKFLWKLLILIYICMCIFFTRHSIYIKRFYRFLNSRWLFEYIRFRVFIAI